MTTTEMQAVIDKAEKNGFIAIPEDPIESNYEAAVEFNNLPGSAQRWLADAGAALKAENQEQKA